MFAFAEGYPSHQNNCPATRSYGKRSDEIRGYVERRFETKYICMGYPYIHFLLVGHGSGCAVYVIWEVVNYRGPKSSRHNRKDQFRSHNDESCTIHTHTYVTASV